jgi:cyclopropane fatty-acyl-phospholipid synthase-like methyltransferase
MYDGTPPWDIGEPQPVFLKVAGGGSLLGRVLDVGCGTGEHAIMAAGLGLDATGVDTAPKAIAAAVAKARARGLRARFLVWDALELSSLGEQFDTVLDCGLFHVFGDEDRSVFVHNLSEVIPEGGRYHVLCFSDREPGVLGPRRVRQQEIRECFAEGWRVDGIEEARIVTTLHVGGGAQAWYAAITRLWRVATGRRHGTSPRRP